MADTDEDKTKKVVGEEEDQKGKTPQIADTHKKKGKDVAVQVDMPMQEEANTRAKKDNNPTEEGDKTSNKEKNDSSSSGPQYSSNCSETDKGKGKEVGGNYNSPSVEDYNTPVPTPPPSPTFSDESDEFWEHEFEQGEQSYIDNPTGSFDNEGESLYDILTRIEMEDARIEKEEEEARNARAAWKAQYMEYYKDYPVNKPSEDASAGSETGDENYRESESESQDEDDEHQSARESIENATQNTAPAMTEGATEKSTKNNTQGKASDAS